MGLKSKLKSIFSKKKNEEPVYQTSSTFQGPIPLGGNEQTFRSTGRTEGGMSQAPQEVIKISSAPQSRITSKKSYQGAVPAGASEEVFRDTGETQGGMSVKPQPKPSLKQRLSEPFTNKTPAERKEEYKQEALKKIAQRDINSVNYQSSSSFIEAPYSSKSGESLFYFTPTKLQLKEASGMASNQFNSLAFGDRARSYTSDVLMGGIRGLEGSAKTISFIATAPVTFGLSGVEGIAEPTFFKNRQLGFAGKTAEFAIPLYGVAKLSNIKPNIPINTKSISTYQGNKILTISKVETPTAPYGGKYFLEGPTKTDYAISTSNIKFNGNKFSASTRTSTKGGVSGTFEIGTIKPTTYDYPINNLMSYKVPITRSTSIGSSKSFGSKGSQAFLSQSKYFTANNQLSAGESFTTPITSTKDKSKYFFDVERKKTGQFVSFPFKEPTPQTQSGFTRLGTGSKKTPFSTTFQTPLTQTQQNFISNYKPQINTQVSTTKSIPITSPITSASAQIYSKPITISSPQLLKTETKYQSKLDDLDFVPIATPASATKEESFTRTSSIVLQQQKSTQRTTQVPIPSTIQAITPLSSSRQRGASVLRGPSPINPTINIFRTPNRGGIRFNLPSLGFNEGLRIGRLGSTRQVKGYTPSFSAIAFGVKGRRSKGVETGFNFRPFRIFSKKKKRKEKK